MIRLIIHPQVIKYNFLLTSISQSTKRHLDTSLKSQLNDIYKRIPTFESASTLQNSIKNVYFNKETRFKRNPSDSPDVIYNIPEKLSPVYTKIGTSKRKPIYVVNRNPSPNEYHLKSIFDENILSHRGPVLVARDHPTKRDDSPGPGAYYKKLSWEKKYPVQILSRRSMFYIDNLKGREVVSPQRYQINMKPVENNRYQGAGIGLGSRVHKYSSFTPGVGQYNLPKMIGLKKFPIN